MRNFWLILSVLWLWTCSGGGGGESPTEPEGPTYIVDLATLQGQAQKGPFNNGTSINIAELTNELSPTGRNFSSAITDNSGRFSVANVQLESPYAELRATGFYFNEVSGNASDAQLTLYALSDLTNKNTVNINIISHLEKNRINLLMSGANPQTFSQSKSQALNEILTIFDFDASGVSSSELLDITQAGDGNAKLLAISAILQGNQSVAQMSELLANISTDISSDGVLNNEGLKKKLKDNSSSLNLSEIRTNLEARLAQLGINGTIPDFESQVEHFLKRPTADDISTTTDQNQAIDITLIGTDPENQALTFQIVQNPSGGSVSINESTATYTPNPTYTGTDYFFYVANNGTSNSDQARVEIVVNDINLAPTAIDSSYTIYSNTSITFSLEASDVDNDNLTYNIIDSPSSGSISQFNINQIIYTPDEDFSGNDSFTFTVNDGEYDSNTATISFLIKSDPSYGTSSGWQGFNSIEKLSNGNLVVTGFTQEDGSSEASKGVIIEYDPSGNIVEENILDFHVDRLTPTSDGNFLILDRLNRGGDIGGAANYIKKISSDGQIIFNIDVSSKAANEVIETSDGSIVYVGNNANNNLIYIVKLDESGNEIWTKEFGDPTEQNRAFDVFEMSNGDLIIGGTTRGFGVTGGHFYVVRVDRDGEEMYQRIFGSFRSEVYDMMELENGNLMLTGEYQHGFQIYMAELDSAGNVINEYLPFSTRSYAHKEFERTLDGGFILVFNDQEFSCLCHTNIGVIKLSSAGTLDWFKSFGADAVGQQDWSGDVEVLDDGTYAVVGTTSSFGPIEGGNGGYTSNGILLFLDADGNDRQSWE